MDKSSAASVKQQYGNYVVQAQKEASSVVLSAILDGLYANARASLRELKATQSLDDVVFTLNERREEFDESGGLVEFWVSGWKVTV